MKVIGFEERMLYIRIPIGELEFLTSALKYATPLSESYPERYKRLLRDLEFVVGWSDKIKKEGD